MLRPAFISSITDAYNSRGKNIIALTGDVYSLFPHNQDSETIFLPLEQKLSASLKDHFSIIHMDMANGLSFSSEEVEEEIMDWCGARDGLSYSEKPQNIRKMIEESRHNPLPTLVLLKGIIDTLVRIRKVDEKVKPVCLLVRHTASIFPRGNFDALSELDRQRLVFFLSWVTDPLFTGSPTLIILVNSVKSEINEKILALPNAAHVEVQLPNEAERKAFVDSFIKHSPISFKMAPEVFCKDTAGLTIINLKDILGSASRTNQPVTKDAIVGEINQILKSNLGDIVRFVSP